MNLDPMDRPPAPATEEPAASSVPWPLRLAAAIVTLVLVFGATGGLLEDRLAMTIVLLTAVPVTAFLFRGDLTPARLRDAAVLGSPILLLPLWVS